MSIGSNELLHITDVGASQGNGVDSSVRIIKQYQRLGVAARVISAGNSPFQVAFVGCTDLSVAAQQSVGVLLAKLKKPAYNLLPIALNSAPRNNKDSQADAKEDFIYRVQYKAQTFVIYGPEVLRWVLQFCSRENVVVEKIISISDVIADTSKGSQFRSAQHLPIVHFLEAEGILNQNSVREQVVLSSIGPVFDADTDCLVAPPDEYGNGRLVVTKDVADKIFTKSSIKISGISNKALKICASLTQVVPGEISLWPSSNYFPNPSLVVLNIGTRWKVNSTSTTNSQVLKLAKKFAKEIGKKYRIKI